MNKTIKTIVVLMAGMILTTGTAVAAPYHGCRCRPAPIHHRCPPPPPPRHHTVHHIHHHGGHEAGWVTLGAAAVGAVVGGLIGAVAR